MALLRPLLLDNVASIQQSAALALGRLANYRRGVRGGGPRDGGGARQSRAWRFLRAAPQFGRVSEGSLKKEVGGYCPSGQPAMVKAFFGVGNR